MLHITGVEAPLEEGCFGWIGPRTVFPCPIYQDLIGIMKKATTNDMLHITETPTSVTFFARLTYTHWHHHTPHFTSHPVLPTPHTFLRLPL